ncbi:MAG TPA: heme ABC transporter permease CcmC [bacterium]|jgi:heme exporter protein C|nr:heme ABC transporter permease CcmC [bacterium]
MRPVSGLTLLAAGAAILAGTGLVFGLILSPPDAFQGEYVRIMYAHVPSAATAYLAVGTVAVASLLYLWKRRPAYDRVAHSAAEIGVLFTGLALASGMIWGKPVWGTWWTWDARLVTTAMLFLIYIGYLLVRELAEDSERGARMAAVIGIVGALDIPVIHYSVSWFRTLHQPASIVRGDIQIAPPMLMALMINLSAFFILYAFLLVLRVRLARLEDARAAAALGETG